jgi:hypothetical protein
VVVGSHPTVHVEFGYDDESDRPYLRSRHPRGGRSTAREQR